MTHALGHFSRLSGFIHGAAEGAAWRFSLCLVQLDRFLGAFMGPFIRGTSMPQHMPGSQAGAMRPKRLQKQMPQQARELEQGEVRWAALLCSLRCRGKQALNKRSRKGHCECRGTGHVASELQISSLSVKWRSDLWPSLCLSCWENQGALPVLNTLSRPDGKGGWVSWPPGL